MSYADPFIDAVLAEQRGIRTGKNRIIEAAENWCNKPSDSAAFHPEQQVKQGQVKTANELLKYLQGNK